MKSTLVLLFACCVLVACALATDKPTLHPYPDVFSAVFSISNIVTGLKYQNNTFYLDLPNKRARTSALSYGDYLLIFRPPGADPTSPFAYNYTQFLVQTQYPSNTTKCYYSLNGYGPWPTPWVHSQKNGQYFKEVGQFYVLPNNLTYAGPYYANDLRIWTDRWDSTDICTLVKSGIGKVPCTSVMFTQGPNPLPAMDMVATPALGNGIDMYLVRTYYVFEPSVSDQDFALPYQWPTACINQ